MANGLLIGKLIYQVLSEDSDITAYVDDKIWPLVAPYEVTNPYIVYYRSNDYSEGITKDGAYGDAITFVVSVFSEKYIECVEIANLVRNSFENHYISNSELEISDIRMTSSSEQFVEDTFIQTLTFECHS